MLIWAGVQGFSFRLKSKCTPSAARPAAAAAAAAALAATVAASGVGYGVGADRETERESQMIGATDNRPNSFRDEEEIKTSAG